MKTFLDCIPCLMKQALRAGKQTGADEKTLKKILDETGSLIKDIPLENTPVETAAHIYKIVSRLTGVKDPYKKIKNENILQAKKLLPELEQKINLAENPLLCAIRISIAGNVIDLGVDKKFNIAKDLDKILYQDFGIFDYDKFKHKLSNSNTVLFVGDNCGESVFDTLLIKQLKKKVYYAVREIPVINDVTYDDAINSGLNEISEIISSGVDSPGAVLSRANNEFKNLFDKADIVISKGQGNYEGLSLEKRDIFFLLKAKCHVIAEDIGVKEDDIILKGINI
ncbi:MAG: ARMT1-like domain-containing protein [Desulforegulaceae bacterium]|nr:ARMT1-like domain-containing protein [Desulforegulaceae bacterium]